MVNAEKNDVRVQEQEVFQIASSAQSSADAIDRAGIAPRSSVIDWKDDVLTNTSFRSIVEASIYFAFVAMP